MCVEKERDWVCHCLSPARAYSFPLLTDVQENHCWKELQYYNIKGGFHACDILYKRQELIGMTDETN